MSETVAATVPVMPDWSAYAGEAFNLTERRPLVILAETDARFVVDGFYHRGEFWRADIPKGGVLEILGQRFNFSKPLRRKDGTTTHPLFFVNHVQARIRMKPDRPVALHAADRDPSAEPAHRIVDFCYSVEAVGPNGRRWNTWDAMLGNLAVVHRFLSTEDVAFERIVRERMTVLQSPPLPLERAVLDLMLQEAVRESARTGLLRPYFMYRVPCSATNCTSEQLRLLDGVLKTPWHRRMLHRLPIHPRGYLKLRGLWQNAQPSPTLNEQMADWVASDAARQRRELHVAKRKQNPRPTQLPKVPFWRHFSSLPKAMRS